MTRQAAGGPKRGKRRLTYIQQRPTKTNQVRSFYLREHQVEGPGLFVETVLTHEDPRLCTEKKKKKI